ncbi:uncharacterized protein LOC116290924 [Actinia tenebrosa]|uniref:Uncharacterized protein LOC116290924 n=1 Tax=Actinia tenebrosa TaxID=6105 RepID=A0A6P8HMN8_ACTTE|nr:uncharacterized protein LOC116290924 [Actinia tenebrosa]
MDNVSDTKRPFTPEFLRLLRNNINKDYLKSYKGFLRMAQLVTLVTAFSALAHYKIIVSSTNLMYYIFMTATTIICLANLVLFCVSFFSLDKKKLPITSKKFIIIYSAFSGHLLLVLSSLLAVEAAQVKSNTTVQSITQKCIKCSKINIAAVFGFLSWILFTVELIQNLMQCRCGKTKVSHVDVQEFETAEHI